MKSYYLLPGFLGLDIEGVTNVYDNNALADESITWK